MTLTEPQATQDSLSADKVAYLLSLMVLNNIDSISFNSFGWDSEDGDLFLSPNSVIPEELKNLIFEAAKPFFDDLFNTFLIDSAENSNSESWEGRLVAGGIGIKGSCDYSIDDSDHSSEEISITKKKQSTLFQLLKSANVKRINFKFSGSGDSGGTDEFEVIMGDDTILKDIHEIQDQIETFVWDSVGTSFNDQGEKGEAVLTRQRNTYLIGLEREIYCTNYKTLKKDYLHSDLLSQKAA